MGWVYTPSLIYWMNKKCLPAGLYSELSVHSYVWALAEEEVPFQDGGLYVPGRQDGVLYDPIGQNSVSYVSVRYSMVFYMFLWDKMVFCMFLWERHPASVWDGCRLFGNKQTFMHNSMFNISEVPT